MRVSFNLLELSSEQTNDLAAAAAMVPLWVLHHCREFHTRKLPFAFCTLQHIFHRFLLVLHKCFLRRCRNAIAIRVVHLTCVCLPKELVIHAARARVQKLMRQNAAHTILVLVLQIR